MDLFTSSTWSIQSKKKKVKNSVMASTDVGLTDCQIPSKQ